VGGLGEVVVVVEMVLEELVVQWRLKDGGELEPRLNSNVSLSTSAFLFLLLFLLLPPPHLLLHTANTPNTV
jgi:hypothetical protein